MDEQDTHGVKLRRGESAPAHAPGPRERVHRFFSSLGPGVITGAADDDPSGISTYSVAGAAFGYAPLWTALFSFPLMAAVQLMCARLGLVTGRGLAGVVRRRYPRWVLWGACALLVAANVVNIGADLGGMAEATELVTGVSSLVWTPLYAGLIVSLLFWSSYLHIVRVFKWLTLVLFAYVLTAFLSRPDWYAVLRSTFVPRVEWSSDYLATFVGILGTTISPYLFFWQAAQEVEEERAQGRRSVARRKGATAEELRRARTDVLTGMFFSNLVMYFIIRLVGTGMLGVPVLAGSCAYALSEAAAWRGSLEDRPRLARKFYAVVAASMALGLALDFLGLDAVKMLFWSAVTNGVLAPPLIVLVVLLTNDPKVMGGHANPPLLRLLGWATAALMAAAAVAMFMT